MLLLLLGGGPEGLRPFGKSPSFALDLSSLGLGSAERAERGRCGPEKWDFRGGEAPSTPPPVEVVVGGDPQNILPVNFQTRSRAEIHPG